MPFESALAPSLATGPRTVPSRTRRQLAPATSSDWPYAPRYASSMGVPSPSSIRSIAHAAASRHVPIVSRLQRNYLNCEQTSPKSRLSFLISRTRATVATAPTRALCLVGGRLQRAAHQVLLRHGERPVTLQSWNSCATLPSSEAARWQTLPLQCRGAQTDTALSVPRCSQTDTAPSVPLRSDGHCHLQCRLRLDGHCHLQCRVDQTDTANSVPLRLIGIPRLSSPEGHAVRDPCPCRPSQKQAASGLPTAVGLTIVTEHSSPVDARGSMYAPAVYLRRLPCFSNGLPHVYRNSCPCRRSRESV
jgi:hypothetical protein